MLEEFECRYQDGWTPKCYTPTTGAPLGVTLQKGDPGRLAEGRVIPQAQHTRGCLVHRRQPEGTALPPLSGALPQGCGHSCSEATSRLGHFCCPFRSAPAVP